MSKATSATLSNSRACEETSITEWVRPPSTKRASVRWSSKLSGVVRPVCASIPGAVTPRVPTMPHFISEAFRMESMMYPVVVLPLVPVMPTAVSFSEGWPCRLAAMPESAFRIFFTRTEGVFKLSSISSTFAPPFEIMRAAP